MTGDDPRKLRASAQHYHSMSLDGDDVHLRAALRQLAEEFEREAAELEEQTGNVTNDTEQPAEASQ